MTVMTKMKNALQEKGLELIIVKQKKNQKPIKIKRRKSRMSTMTMMRYKMLLRPTSRVKPKKILLNVQPEVLPMI